jgi:hypothetical protein
LSFPSTKVRLTDWLTTICLNEALRLGCCKFMADKLREENLLHDSSIHLLFSAWPLCVLLRYYYFFPSAFFFPALIFRISRQKLLEATALEIRFRIDPNITFLFCLLIVCLFLLLSLLSRKRKS